VLAHVYEFIYRFIEGDLRDAIQLRFGLVYHRIIVEVAGFLTMAVFTITMGYFRPFQPQKNKHTSIINFLNQDQHDQWRYLPLGFGDQMPLILSNKSL
jgi:hypothetical protein